MTRQGKRALKTTLSGRSDAKITLRSWQSKHAPAASQGRVEFLLSFITFDVCLKAFKALVEGCQMCSGIFFFFSKTQIYVFRSTKGGKAQSSKRGQKTHYNWTLWESWTGLWQQIPCVPLSDHRHIRSSSKYKHLTTLVPHITKSLVISSCCL